MCVCSEHADQPAQGSTVAETGSPAAETRPLLSIQRRRVDTADGCLHSTGSLARLCLVLHRTRRTPIQRRQLDCRSAATLHFSTTASLSATDRHIIAYSEAVVN